jgi:hypothetical protein
MKFIVLPSAQATLARNALAQLEGLPRRATVDKGGASDLVLTAELGASLDTTDCVGASDSDGAIECFELPESLEVHLGKTVSIGEESITLPTLAELADGEDALPETLRAVRQENRDVAQNAAALLPGQ